MRSTTLNRFSDIASYEESTNLKTIRILIFRVGGRTFCMDGNDFYISKFFVSGGHGFY